jgi:hypothetical protein
MIIQFAIVQLWYASLEHDRVYCFLRKLPKLAISLPWANANTSRLFRAIFPNTFRSTTFQTQSATAIVSYLFLKSQIASVMSFVPSSNFAISKTD